MVPYVLPRHGAGELSSLRSVGQQAEAGEGGGSSPLIPQLYRTPEGAHTGDAGDTAACAPLPAKGSHWRARWMNPTPPPKCQYALRMALGTQLEHVGERRHV